MCLPFYRYPDSSPILSVDVTQIVLSANSITIINTNTFNGLLSLQSLDLSDNFITYIGVASFSSFTQLINLCVIWQNNSYLTMIK